MTEHHSTTEAARDLILDRIYEIALEPAALDGFIDFWHDNDLVTHIAAPDTGFDAAYRNHLDRAQAILQRGETTQPELMDYLRPYNNLAAFLVSRSLRIEAANPGAVTAFGLTIGAGMPDLAIPVEMRDMLIQTLDEVLASTTATPERLLKAELPSKGGTILFRVLRLDDAFAAGPLALVVSTQFQWRSAISALLGDVFQLTAAEQDVVRRLVAGKDAKTIATERATSEGTTRGQIKSITAKMNLRSQTDIVRLVMTLGDFPKGPAQGPGEDHNMADPPNNWLEKEVWKPFRTLTLPDGRRLDYHDMGPLAGHPVLLSHMGSCMVRWPRPMLRLAFRHNLRILCPIRAGYGFSDAASGQSDAFATHRADTAFLLESLGLGPLPFVAQGTDFPLAADFAAHHPGLVSAIIGIGARPCLPGGAHIEGSGRWQRFFVSTARHAPHLVQFASRAVMAMCKRIGPEAMLRKLCKESPADMALLEDPDTRKVLEANLALMAGKSTNAAPAFAAEFIAFQSDWSASVAALETLPLRIFLAEEDPTIDLAALPQLQAAYPWMRFEVMPRAGLALLYQHPEALIGAMAEAARTARRLPG